MNTKNIHELYAQHGLKAIFDSIRINKKWEEKNNKKSKDVSVNKTVDKKDIVC